MARVDLSGVDPDKQRGPRELPPPGCYPLICVDAEERESKRTQHPYFNLKWEIVAGPHAGSWIFDILMLAGKGAGMGVQKIKALLGRAPAHEEEVEAMEFLNIRAWGHVKHDTYNGKSKCVIDLEGGTMGYEPAGAHPWPDGETNDGADRNESGGADTGEPDSFDDIPF